ncbi:MAG: hypothetical protein AAGF50_13490 [Pseudomonadota bacterium]
MGFPFEQGTWEGVSGAIFMGLGTAMPGLYSVIAIAVCIGALAIGQGMESSKYKNHK